MALPEPDASIVADALVGLHRHLEEQETLDDTLLRVAEAAHAAIPGCDAAAITVSEHSHFRTAALAGAPAQSLDDAQYASGDGPCLVALRENRVVEVADIAASTWPEFAAAAEADGYRSSLSLPLSTGSLQIGALNLYCRRAQPFSPAEAAIADRIASEGAVAAGNLLSLRRMQAMVLQLGEALESRDLIGQAKGILMAQRRVSADDAFAELVETSQRRNIKVRELARQIVETGSIEPSAS